MANQKRKTSKKRLAELLTELGFVNKPWVGKWGTYSDTWWYQGKPLITMSALRGDPREITRTLLLSFTPEIIPYSDNLNEADRKDFVNKLILQLCRGS